MRIGRITLHFLSPFQDEEADQNEIGLIADVRNAIPAGHIELDGDVSDGTYPQGYLSSPLTREEIWEEIHLDDFCQTVISTQVGRPSTFFFERSDGVLCRRNSREPEIF